MREYEKLKRIDKFSNVVGCFKRLQTGKLELFLIVIQIIILILCIMNILIVPHNELKLNPIFGLRIAILFFLILSLIVVIFNKICRNKRKMNSGYIFAIGFFGSLGALVLVPINFLFVLIATIVTQARIKKNEGTKKYDSSSILAIDIFTILILIAIFFFWYVEVIFIYSRVKSEESLKEMIENQKKIFESQNEKVVNVEINEKFDENNKGDENNINNINQGTNNEFDDITSSNKVSVKEDKESNQSKDDNISEKVDDISNEGK